ncbi:hypothetical protein B0H34DRAFT_662599 [Crassisporium funariophilum]|nr:hypothetical protein B0H34DRAFT_662599 [Crassisporium funariophilum]
MSLTKIPFIILASWGFTSCITPPNPPPSKDERIGSHVFEGHWYTQGVPMAATVLQYLAAFLEISTLLACATPSSPWSKIVLSLFVFEGGRPQELRITQMTAIGTSMILVGTWIRLMTFRYLGRFFRFEASIQKDHQLITSGPYSIVRHPSYTGLCLSHPGWFLWQFGRGSWVRESGVLNNVIGQLVVVGYAGLVVLGTLALVLPRMSKEDAALKKKFGKEWEEWARRVPYSIFPGVY